MANPTEELKDGVLNAILTSTSEEGGEPNPQEPEAKDETVDEPNPETDGEETDEIEAAGDPEQDADGDEDPDDPDADDDDEDADPDGEPESDSTYKVKVDGEEIEVTLEELKRGYSGQAHLQKRHDRLRANEQQLMQEADNVQRARSYYLSKLEELNRLETELTPKEPDWDTLRQEDPIAWAEQRELWRSRKEARQERERQIQAARQEAEAHQQSVYTRYLQTEAEMLLQKMPELADAEKAPVFKRQLAEAAELYGISPAELEAVADHRPLMVLRDAMLYRQSQKQAKPAAEPQATAPSPSPAPGAKPRPARLRPGAIASGSQSASQQKKAKQIKDRARRTGKVDDVAMTLLLPD